MTHGLRVLHVDDEPDLAETVSQFLTRENRGMTVEAAHSADEGLELIRRGGFDGVISDYDMPGKNGIEFLEAVREEHPNLPFILFTGKGSEEIASRAISAGVTDYLQKESGTSQYTVLANRINNAVEQHRAREAFEATQKQLSLFIEQSPLGVIEWDDDFRVRRVNESAERILGYSQTELVGKDWELLVGDADLETVGETVSNLLEDQGGYHSLNTNVRKDGTVITCEWYNWVVTDRDDSVVAVFSQFRDVTERVERIREIERHQQQFRYVEDVAKIGYWEIDTRTPEPHTVTLSDGVYQLHELSSDEPFDVELGFEFYHRDDRPMVVEAVERAVNDGEPFEFDARFITSSGNELEVHSEGQPIVEDGDIVGVRGVIQDVSERKEYERRLRQQNESLDKFAKIVSHDLRNPLTVAMGRLEFVRANDDDEHVEAIERAHERMQVLIDDLLALARDGGSVRDFERVALDSLVRECWDTIDHGDATLTADSDLAVNADRSRLKQLLENLIRNAVEHGGDDVSIALGGLADGFYLEDDGPGIPEADRDEVFEAGYTTSQNGTGFGLSIVSEVAEAHGWNVRVVEGSEGGARFEVTGVEEDRDPSE